MTDQASAQRQTAGAGLFALLFFILAVTLLWFIGSETRYTPGKLLFAQPRFWPAIGLIGMATFGLAHLITTIRSRRAEPRNGSGATVGEALTWLRALEYYGWFMLYVAAVPVIGYLAATLFLTAALSIRTGYGSARSVLLAMLTGFVIVLVFKTLLAVKIPGGAVYDYLPAALRNFMIVNF